MKIFLQCSCPGSTRDKRGPNCDHKWKAQFKHEWDTNPHPFTIQIRVKKDAERWANSYRENFIKHRQGKPVDEDFAHLFTGATRRRGKGECLADLRDRFMAVVEARGNRNTTRRYRHSTGEFVRIIGADTMVHAVDVATIERWRQTRLSTPSARRKDEYFPQQRTINTEMIGVQAMFQFAGRAHLLFGKVVVINGVRKPGILKWKDQKFVRKHRPLTASELELAYAKLPDPFDVICRVTHQTLARLSEVTHLRQGDVGTSLDSDGELIGWMIRRQKGGKEVRTTLPIHLAMQLMARPTTKAQPWLFPGLQNDSTSGKFRKKFDAIGLTCSHHAFKHTAVTEALDAGESPVTITSFAGWTSPRQLPTYGHVSDHSARKLVARSGANVARILAKVKRDPIPYRPRQSKPRQKVSA